jgi:hypothetical protein
MVIDLLFHVALDENSDLELPMSIAVVADDRTISVAGQDLQFSGVRVEGRRRWAGEAEHGSVVIRAITSTDAPAFSIEPCCDGMSLSEFPPAGP